MDFMSALGLGAAVLNPIAGLIGAKYSADRAQDQATWALGQEERLANTAHQRQIADLRAAGLNPILSGLGGGGAAMASAKQAAVPDMGTAAGSLAGSVHNAVNLWREIKETNAGVRNLDAQSQLALSQAMLNMLNQDNVPVARKKMLAETAFTTLKSETERLEQQARGYEMPGKALTGKLEGSPAYRAAKVGGAVMEKVAGLLLPFGLLKGLSSARQAPSNIKTYPANTLSRVNE